jgi:predicted exporter
LCGAGELLTSVAILALTPEIGARLERGAPPAIREATWLGWARAAVATPRRARITLVAMALPVVAILVVGWPHASDAIVTIRPTGLAPLVTQDEVYRLFGGRSGQWIVMTSDRDADRARARADAIAEALDPLAHDHTIDGYDALTTFAPSEETVRARLSDRDALDLPAAASRLDLALRDPALGFDHDGFVGAIDALAHPAADAPRVDLASDALAWIAARHVAKDGDETLVATFVRSTGDAESDRRALAAIHAADPRSVVTGFPLLDGALRASLARDLPRVGFVALAVAAVALGATLRKGKHVALALAVVVVEIAALGVAMRLAGIHWHAYDALVVPVLIGITLDESMFLLYGAPTPEEALRVQGPLVTTTALTTASGFAALLVCRYPGLFDVGAVGALGVTFGWLASLLVVGAGLRLAR